MKREITGMTGPASGTKRSVHDRVREIFAWWTSLDGRFMAIVVALVIAGILAVTSSSFAMALSVHNDAWFFTRKQLGSAALGVACFFVISNIPATLIKRWSPYAFGISAIMLMAVPVIGRTALGAKRWLFFGPIQVQPSEIVKFTAVIWLAAMLSMDKRRVKSVWQHWIPIGAIAILTFMTERQPDLGTALCIAIGVIATLFVSNINWKQIAATVVLGVMCVGIMVFAPQGGHDYRSGRFAAVANPAKDKDGAGMQNWRSLVALANGGATGLGLGQSREKRRGGVPMQRTDFIFAVVGEEVGLVGTLSLLAMYLWLLMVGINLSVRSTDPFSRYTIAGITSSIVGQALLNMAVVTSIVPATGIPLPLVSYGGTSLVLTLSALGVVAALSRRKPARYIEMEK